MVNSMRITPRDRVDSLIDHFWRNGFLTVSRKYGTYLPSPKPIGSYEVDAIGKYKRTFVLGLVLTDKDLEDPRLAARIDYLSSPNTKYSNRKTKLLLGTQKHLAAKLREIVSTLPKEKSSNIRIIIVK